MRGEIPREGSSLGGMSRSLAPKDPTLPNTPNNSTMRHPPSYQRMHSNESRGSDKDSTSGRD